MCIENVVPNHERTRVVFVLESPYRAEVESGYPLAGASGVEVSRVLNETGATKIPSGIPFGQYLTESKDDRFAIINCSSKPMDKKTYSYFPPDKISAPSDIDSIAFIRRNPWVAPKRRKSKTISDCQESLIKQFGLTWSSIDSNTEGLLIIACGRLSQGFLESIGFKKPFYVPHPSRNQWRYRNNKSHVARLKRKISRKL